MGVGNPGTQSIGKLARLSSRRTACLNVWGVWMVIIEGIGEEFSYA